MDVKIENAKSRNIVEVGDIIWYYNSDFPTIITEQTINGPKREGLNGIDLGGVRWSSDPIESVKNRDAKLYKKNEWELILRRK